MDKKLVKHSFDWICKKCNYLNFKRNHFCKKCYCDKNGDEIIFSDWICNKCFKVNEIDFKVGKIKKDEICECGQTYSSQDRNNLPIDLAYQNEYENVKKVYEKLGIYIDWECLKNINCGISNAIDLLTRKHINKQSICNGIENVVMARDPDTGHVSDCVCNWCIQ